MTLALVPVVGAALLALSLALVVVARGGRSLAGVSFSAAMIGQAVAQVGQGLLIRGNASVAGLEVRDLAELVTLPAWAVFGITFGKPDARSQLRRWWWAIGLTGAMVVGGLAGWLVQPLARVEIAGGREIFLLTPLGKAGAVATLLVSVFVLFQLESTLRNSSGGGRRRIKYLVLALFGLVGSHVFGLSQEILHGQILISRIPIQSAMALVALGLMTVTVARDRLLDVDVFVSRQAVYSFVAVGTVGAYLFMLGLASEILVLLGIMPDLFVFTLVVFLSAMALVAALLSERVRSLVKRWISKHFYRTTYDYRQEWMEFTAQVARVARPDRMPVRVLERVTQSIGTRVGALWLKAADGRWRLAASMGARNEIAGLDLETLVESIAEGQTIPLAFSGCRTARIVPLKAEGQVIGLLAVGMPGNRRLTFEDEELIGTIATQAASVVLTGRLSEELARAREMEAIHRVSTFVLHDLKNCVAMLSLVSQNAEKHGEKPGFQRDAFRAVDESVRQMQALMSKLNSPVPPLELALPRVRVNKLVEDVVAQVREGAGSGVSVHTNLDSAADGVAVSEETVRTILSNLLLNAVQVVGAHGRIEVATSREGPWLTLRVTDTGCGMSDEFVRYELFAPFRSTKTNGLGVGLYQVKSIVEALGGAVRVESRQGMGTTFWVELPADGPPG